MDGDMVMALDVVRDKGALKRLAVNGNGFHVVACSRNGDVEHGLTVIQPLESFLASKALGDDRRKFNALGSIVHAQHDAQNHGDIGCAGAQLIGAHSLQVDITRLIEGLGAVQCTQTASQGILVTDIGGGQIPQRLGGRP